MTEHEGLEAPSTTRRMLLLGAGAIGAAGVLAACGSDGPAPSSPPPAGGGATPAPQPATEGTGGGAIQTSDIPVGGGKIYADARVVVTQPAAGSFKAFSATCTHMACTVADVSDGKIKCPCHGSQYNIADGSVAQGPATRPLPPKMVTVNGSTLTVS
jgi:Rieske Fe-S protein